MKNETGRKKLERLYGKGCFMERAGIREITPDEEELLKKTIKGFKKLDRTMTYHHIKQKSKGGKVTIENGANLAAYNHQWLHAQPPQIQAEINAKLRDFKYKIDMARLSVGDDGLEFNKINLDFNMEDCIEIPVYDNILLKDEPAKRPKFNRAKEKIKTQKFIEEEIEEWNRE